MYTTRFIVCAMILTAGASVRFVREVDRKEIRPLALIWKGVELFALALLFDSLW